MTIVVRSSFPFNFVISTVENISTQGTRLWPPSFCYKHSVGFLFQGTNWIHQHHRYSGWLAIGTIPFNCRHFIGYVWLLCLLCRRTWRLVFNGFPSNKIIFINWLVVDVVALLLMVNEHVAVVLSLTWSLNDEDKDGKWCDITVGVAMTLSKASLSYSFRCYYAWL